jgi:hypothetical protein
VARESFSQWRVRENEDLQVAPGNNSCINSRAMKKVPTRSNKNEY